MCYKRTEIVIVVKNVCFLSFLNVTFSPALIVHQIGGRWGVFMNEELWGKWLWSVLNYCLTIFLEGMRKNVKISLRIATC